MGDLLNFFLIEERTRKSQRFLGIVMFRQAHIKQKRSGTGLKKTQSDINSPIAIKNIVTNLQRRHCEHHPFPDASALHKFRYIASAFFLAPEAARRITTNIVFCVVSATILAGCDRFNFA